LTARSDDIGPVVEALRQAGLDTVQGAFDCAEGRDLHKPGLGRRRRTELSVADRTGRSHRVYLKRYGPEPLSVWLRRRITTGRGGSPAVVEFENIRTLRELGIPTMHELLCGQERSDGGGRSYLIVTAVPGDALERSLEGFLAEADATAVEEFTQRLAELVGRFHRAGYVHRDLYASHIFLDASRDQPDLYLIDLARMFAPRLRRFRWRVKDLAALKHSLPPEWTGPWWDSFLRRYVRIAGGRTERIDRAVDRKVAWMRRRAGRKSQQRSVDG